MMIRSLPSAGAWPKGRLCSLAATLAAETVGCWRLSSVPMTTPNPPVTINVKIEKPIRVRMVIPPLSVV